MNYHPNSFRVTQAHAKVAPSLRPDEQERGSQGPSCTNIDIRWRYYLLISRMSLFMRLYSLKMT